MSISKEDRPMEFESVIAWIRSNNFVNENGKPIELTEHRFLFQPYADDHPDQVIMKSAQIGWSTLAILKTMHLAAYKGLNIAYTLPTQNVMKDFVEPKVDAMIRGNDALQNILKSDRLNLKRYNDRYIYYRGSFTEREAITISVDLLVCDELDRSDQKILGIYKSRLQASEFGWQWRFSNPSVNGFGVHELWLSSDQHRWIIQCTGCKKWQTLTWDDSIDKEKEIFICSNCNKELTKEERINGKWKAFNPGAKRRGYQVSQLMAPWVKASKICEAFREESPEFFANFVLGEPYTIADLLIDRSALIKCLAPGKVPMEDMCLGVDNGVIKHWVLGNKHGVVRYGKTESWDEIERIIKHYNCYTLIDANPYPNVPKDLADRYKGQVFIHYYVPDRKSLGMVRKLEKLERGVIQSDRTKIIDFVAGEITGQRLRFIMPEREMEEMITHCSNVYRTIEETSQQIKRGVWLTKENKPDHFLHALVYWRIILEEAMRPTGNIVRPLKKKYQPDAIVIDDNQEMAPVTDPREVAKRKRKKKDWRTV